MTLDRRKVLIYLRPDISASERFADAKIEAHHRGDRGDMSRTALLAGLARSWWWRRWWLLSRRPFCRKSLAKRVRGGRLSVIMGVKR